MYGAGERVDTAGLGDGHRQRVLADAGRNLARCLGGREVS